MQPQGSLRSSSGQPTFIHQQSHSRPTASAVAVSYYLSYYPASSYLMATR